MREVYAAFLGCSEPALIFSWENHMQRPALLAGLTLATLLLSATSVCANSPTRISFEIDETFPNDFLTAVCNVPVWVHVEGAGTTTLFHDASSTQLIREFDILPGGLTTTIYSPVQLGGTGKSFTEVTQSPATFLYPDGTDVGDPAFVILNGVQRTSGPGNPRIVGYQVFEAIIIGVTPDGVPIADPVALLFQAGQFDLGAVLEARCELLAP